MGSLAARLEAELEPDCVWAGRCGGSAGADAGADMGGDVGRTVGVVIMGTEVGPEPVAVAASDGECGSSGGAWGVAVGAVSEEGACKLSSIPRDAQARLSPRKRAQSNCALRRVRCASEPSLACRV